MNGIRNLLTSDEQKRVSVAIVGDCMIDQYYRVAADKISPEFPIVRMLSADESDSLVLPGGASNVAMMFRDFSVDVNLFGFLDNYSQGIMQKSGLTTEHCILMQDAHVPVKRRLYHGEFPLCRWDVEQKYYGFADIRGGRITLERYQEELYERFLRYSRADVVILSDYDKGVFAYDAKRNWVKDDRITIVDPKKGKLEDWEGCYIFKPNSKEARELSGGLERWQDQCKFFQSVLRCKAVVITKGADGVVGIIDGRLFEYRPTARMTADSMGYSGAGDCFVAFLAMCVARGMDVEESSAVACNAAGIYVTKRHNQPVTKLELLRLVDPIEAKLRYPDNKVDRTYKLVFTNGCFDILHYGHIKLLQEAKLLGDKLVVALNSDASVAKLKGKTRPIIPLEQRMKMVAALECVDYVVSFEEETPHEIVQRVKPEVLVKGSDWDGNIVGSDVADQTVALPLIKGLSTTNIIEKIRSVSD